MKWWASSPLPLFPLQWRRPCYRHIHWWQQSNAITQHVMLVRLLPGLLLNITFGEDWVSCVLYTCASVLTLTRHIKVYLRIIYEILWHVSIHTQLPTVTMLLPCTVSNILALLKHVTANDVQKSFIFPKEMTTICANVPTTLLYLRTASLLWNRILFIEWFLKTFIDFYLTFNVILLKHFYSETFIVL